MSYSRKGQVSVLLVGNFLSGHNGTRGVCEDLALRLSASGHHITATSNKPNKLLRALDMLKTAWQNRRDYNVALVDLYSGPAFIWAEATCWILRKMGKPYAITLHGGALPDFALRFPKRVKRLLKSAVLVTTPSRFLLDRMWHYRSDLCLQPNPLDINAYRYKHRNKCAPNLIYLRAFHEIYNPTLAVRILATLAKDFEDIRLAMVGPDKGDGSLTRTKALAKHLGVYDRMTLPGSVPKSSVPQWLDRGDIFLNTTNIDNTPVSVLEAMACGLCIVSTNVGGIPYLLEDEHDALLVPPDDPKAMAKAVRRILNEKGLSARLSSNARKKAEAFDWSVILPKWQELLTKVAES